MQDRCSEPYLTKIASEKALELGLPEMEGHNDALDAFRHTYISALITYYGGSTIASALGWINEIKGDIFNKQPPSERHMDEFNNE